MTSFHVIQDVKISHIYFLNSLVNFHSLYTLKSLFQDKKREEFEALIFFFPQKKYWTSNRSHKLQFKF